MLTVFFRIIFLYIIHVVIIDIFLVVFVYYLLIQQANPIQKYYKHENLTGETRKARITRLSAT